jgi:hypothetical protein
MARTLRPTATTTAVWELLTSTRVFDEGVSIGQMFYMIAYQGWRPAIPANCPHGYAELMMDCWAEEPDQRPTALQLLRRLQKLYTQQKAAAAAEQAAGGADAADGGAGSSSAAAGAGAADVALRGGRGSDQGSGGGGGGSAERYRAAKTAAAQAMAAVGVAPQGGPGSGPAVGSADSVGSHGRGAGSSGGSAAQQGSGGSGGAKEGSSGSSVEREMLPYAAAVLHRKRSGSLPVASTAGGSQGGRTSAGRQQLLWQQQQQQVQQQILQQQALARQQQAAQQAGSAGGSEISPCDEGTADSNVQFPSTMQLGGTGTAGSIEYSSPVVSSEMGASSTQQQQQQMDMRMQQQGVVGELDMGRGAGRPGAPPAAACRQAGSSSSYYRDSFSTGTMPSVMDADSLRGSLGPNSSFSLHGLGSFRMGSAAMRMHFGVAAHPASVSTASSMLSGGSATGPAGPSAAAAAAAGGDAAPAPQPPVAGVPGLPPPGSSSALQTVQEAGSTPESPAGSFTDTGTARAAGGGPASGAAAGAAPSPFAAMAARTGSLFAPLKLLMLG